MERRGGRRGSSGGTNWTNVGRPLTLGKTRRPAATFDGTGGAVTLSGAVIAHGLTINSTGYTFSGGSLTVTAGGIQANESVTFSSDVYIGGPQSWNVAAGKTLTVNGPLHTIISDLTFTGAGNTIISGPIDGGGVLNIYGGAKPGGLDPGRHRRGHALRRARISPATSRSTRRRPVEHLAQRRRLPPRYSGGLFGGGTINVNCAGTFSLGGGASNFTGTLEHAAGGHAAIRAGRRRRPARSAAPSTAAARSCRTVRARPFLPATNNYSGNTTISDGALQANIGAGIPAASFLMLDGGVLQSNGGSASLHPQPRHFRRHVPMERATAAAFPPAPGR